MPVHWRLQFDWIPWPLHIFITYALRYLCLVSLGHSSLQQVWDVCHADRREWRESNDRLYDRLNTIVVVVRSFPV
jgi:hypothetical protein